MRNKSEEKIKLNMIDVEEERINTMMFYLGMIIAIGGGIAVMGFLGGTAIDLSVSLIVVAFLIFRIMEKYALWFKPYAKYAYLTLPFWVNCLLVITDNGKYAGATQVHFMFIIVALAYYDVKMILWYAGVTIISTAAAYIVRPSALLQLVKPGVWGYILFIYIITVIIAVVMARHMRYMLEKTRKMKTYEDELTYLEQLEKKDKKQSEFIHNISHYFIAIGELARSENCENIVNLVEELNGKLRRSERIIYSKYKVLNGILAEKVNSAKEQNIDLEVYVEPMLQLDGISDGDLVSMMGNLLDNALEAAMQCEGEKRKIHVWIYMENDGRVCVIKIENYFTKPVIQNKFGFVSTKKNKELHGIGLKSVGRTAKKYKGYLQCLTEDDRFTAILILADRV